MKTLPYIYIILASVLWGTSGLFAGFLSKAGLTSIQMTGIRTSVAAVSMILYALIGNRRLFKATPKEIALFVLSGIALFLTGTFYFMAMQASSVSTAVVLMYTAPIFVMIYSVSVLGERLTPLKIFSVAIMLVGCCFVSGIIGGMVLNLRGIILGLLSGLAYSMYNIVTRIEMKNGSNPVSASMYCFILAAIIALFVSNPLGIVQTALKCGAGVSVVMLLCGVCTCILPYFFYTLALKSIPAGTASSLAITEPMAATIFSILFLGERPSVFSMFGIILIICSVFLLSRVKE